MVKAGSKLTAILGVLLVSLLLGEVAGEAQDGSGAPDSEVGVRQQQEVALQVEVEGLTGAGPQLKEAQDLADVAEARTRELEEQAQNLTEQADS